MVLVHAAYEDDDDDDDDYEVKALCEQMRIVSIGLSGKFCQTKNVSMDLCCCCDSDYPLGCCCCRRIVCLSQRNVDGSPCPGRGSLKQTQQQQQQQFSYMWPNAMHRLQSSAQTWEDIVATRLNTILGPADCVRTCIVLGWQHVLLVYRIDLNVVPFEVDCFRHRTMKPRTLIERQQWTNAGGNSFGWCIDWAWPSSQRISSIFL